MAKSSKQATGGKQDRANKGGDDAAKNGDAASGTSATGKASLAQGTTPQQ